MPGGTHLVSGRLGEARKYAGKLGCKSNPCPAASSAAGGNAKGTELFAAKHFRSHARIMNGKGLAAPLAGGTNWTACIVRLNKRNLVVISV
eukprot:2733399-Pyramimonas_sp.AAC.1